MCILSLFIVCEECELFTKVLKIMSIFTNVDKPYVCDTPSLYILRGNNFMDLIMVIIQSC